MLNILIINPIFKSLKKQLFLLICLSYNHSVDVDGVLGFWGFGVWFFSVITPS